MRFVVPYTLSPTQTVAALTRARARAIEIVYVGGARSDYHRLLAALWDAGRTFAVVEHDIEIHEEVVPTFESCAHDWCLYPYPRHLLPETLLTENLGCTRFGEKLLTSEPDLIQRAGEFPEKPMDWSRLDDAIRLELRRRGYAPVLHGPPVRHLEIVG